MWLNLIISFTIAGKPGDNDELPPNSYPYLTMPTGLNCSMQLNLPNACGYFNDGQKWLKFILGFIVV